MKQPSIIVKTVCLALLIGLAYTCSAQVQYLSENFMYDTANGWTFITGMGDGPSLTAGTGVDSAGSGWLRLTENKTNQASFVYNETALPTENGLRIRFDFAVWADRSWQTDSRSPSLMPA